MSDEQNESSVPVEGQPADVAAAGSMPDAALSPEPAGEDRHEELQTIEQQVRRTRISATWVAIMVAIVVLVLLLIFILQNLRNVTITYFGASGQLPLGVALLFAAIGGALIVAIVGVARLTQLRLNARRRQRASIQSRNTPRR